MTLDLQLFDGLITIAFAITCISPCVLVGLFINDYLKGRLW